jgi:hypothetical protein
LFEGRVKCDVEQEYFQQRLFGQLWVCDTSLAGKRGNCATQFFHQSRASSVRNSVLETSDTFCENIEILSQSSNDDEAAANDDAHHFIYTFTCEGSFIYALSVMHRIEGICTKFRKFAKV